MAIGINLSHRFRHSMPTEKMASVDAAATFDSDQPRSGDPISTGIGGSPPRRILSNGIVLSACGIGITVISVGAAALVAIDGLRTICRPKVLAAVPLAIALMVSAVFCIGILYLMVLALLAMSDEFIFGDQTPIDDRNEQQKVTPNTLR